MRYQLKHLLIVLGFVATGFGFMLYAVGLGGGLPSLGSTYKVKAYLPSSGQLATGAQVTVAGARVGRVAAVERRGVGAIVEMEITDDRVTPLPGDSQAELRARTPVGENYMSIKAGRSDTTLPSGGLADTSSADPFVDVDQILSILQGNARQGARRIIQRLAYGVEGRGRRLNAVVDDGTRLTTDGAQLVDVLNHDRKQLSRLVDGLGRVSAAIGERDGAIHQLAQGGLTSFRALASRDEALRRLLKVLPPTLDQVRATTTTVRKTSGQATPVLAELADAVREIRPSVRRLRPAAIEGRHAARALGTAAPALQQTLRRVRALAKPAPDALAQLRGTLCQVNPMVRYLAPYTDDVISALTALGSGANSYDATGHLLRLLPIVDENSLAGLPANVSLAAHTLMHAGLLGTTVGRLDFDPFPKPGQIGKTKAKPGGATGPDDVPRTGYKYPRIHPDCK